MNNLLKTIIRCSLSLLLCAYTVSSAAQTDATKPIAETAEVIAEGVRVVKVYQHRVTVDTFTIEQWINLQADSGRSTREMEQSNKRLMEINEQMKKPED